MADKRDYLTEFILNQKLPDLDLDKIKQEAIRSAALQGGKSVPSLAPKPTPEAMSVPEKVTIPSNAYMGPGGTMIQRQEPIMITPEPEPNEWAYIQDDDSNPPELENWRASANQQGRNIKNDVNYYADNIKKQREAVDGTKGRLASLAEKYLQPSQRYESPYAEMAKKIAQEGAKDNRAAMPEEDLLTKAIYSFGPGVLGAATGEEGMAAAAPAQAGAYAIRAADRKEAMERYKTKQNEGTKRQVALKLLMDSDQEAFNKQNDLDLKKSEQAEKIFSKLSKNDYEVLNQEIKNRAEVLKQDYETGRLALTQYNNGIQKLADLRNNIDVAYVTTGAGLVKTDLTNDAMLKRAAGDRKARMDEIEAKSAGAEKIAKIAASSRLAAAGKRGVPGRGGKPLTTSAVEGFSNGDTALDSLNDMKSLVRNNPELFGRGAGIMGSISIASGIGDTATNAASVDADLLSKAQIIGRYLEGGKLAEGDIARYRKMLPARGDKPAIVQNKIVNLERMLQQKFQNDKKSFGSAGYDVSNFENKQVGPGLTKGLGNGAGAQAPAGGVDPQVDQYAKANKLTYEKALSILTKRGYKPQ